MSKVSCDLDEHSAETLGQNEQAEALKLGASRGLSKPWTYILYHVYEVLASCVSRSLFALV